MGLGVGPASLHMPYEAASGQAQFGAQANNGLSPLSPPTSNVSPAMSGNSITTGNLPSGTAASGLPPFSLSNPPSPQGDGDMQVLQALGQGISSTDPKQQLNAVLSSVFVAAQQLPPKDRGLYFWALNQETSKGKVINPDAFNAMVLKDNGGQNPVGPFGLWALDLGLVLVAPANGRKVPGNSESPTTIAPSAAMIGQNTSANSTGQMPGAMLPGTSAQYQAPPSQSLGGSQSAVATPAT